MEIEKVLSRITTLIVQCCDPHEIILFGSYAKGYNRLESDLDILVIGNFRGSPYLRAHELQALLSRFLIPIDLHLVTPEELAIESCKPYGFLSNVQRHSVSLYRKAEERT